jgi:hypothetical protein
LGSKKFHVNEKKSPHENFGDKYFIPVTTLSYCWQETSRNSHVHELSQWFRNKDGVPSQQQSIITNHLTICPPKIFIHYYQLRSRAFFTNEWFKSINGKKMHMLRILPYIIKMAQMSLFHFRIHFGTELLILLLPTMLFF